MTPSALSSTDQLEEFERGLRIEPGGRFVENGDIGLLDDDFGKPKPLPHAARECRHPLVGDFGQADSLQRRRDPPRPLRRRKTHQFGGISQILDGGEVIVETDGVRQIADPALDLQRRARRITAEHADDAGGNLGQAEHHQDRRGLAGAVRPEQSKHLALDDIEVDGVDRVHVVVTLGKAPRRDHDLVCRRDGLLLIAHRRPNLATAPSINSSATPITPAPTIPHTVEVATVIRNWPDALSPRDVARTVVM